MAAGSSPAIISSQYGCVRKAFASRRRWGVIRRHRLPIQKRWGVGLNGPYKLYTYWRSSAAYRVRIALNLKQIEHELVPVHLVRNGGEQNREPYRDLNPQGLVPVLLDGDRVLRQSMAIIEYLEELYPEPPLLPANLRSRARVRALANVVTCEIHPLNNLRVMIYLEKEAELNSQARRDWYHYWIAEGFQAFESLLDISPTTGEFCEGDSPTLADICLVPQVYNAMRFKCDLSPYPNIQRIYDNCLSLMAFDRAQPEKQPDAQE